MSQREGAGEQVALGRVGGQAEGTLADLLGLGVAAEGCEQGRAQRVEQVVPVEIGKLCPARFGGVEVRPIMVFN